MRLSDIIGLAGNYLWLGHFSYLFGGGLRCNYVKSPGILWKYSDLSAFLFL